MGEVRKASLPHFHDRMPRMSKMKKSAMKKPLVVANWKMNPATLDTARKLFIDTRKLTRNITDVEIVVVPPFPYLADMYKLTKRGHILVGAQDSFYKPKGPYTGEVSLSMLKSVGVSYVIVGHSERRALGETNEDVNQKAIAVIKNGMTAIVCVGEKQRDSHGHYFTAVERQLRTALNGLSHAKLKELVIAYEPVWAISKGDGRGHTATHEDAHEMKLFIRKILVDRFGRSAISKVRILYGGSVNEKNAHDFIDSGEMDGYLIGGASLRSGEFSEIVQIIHRCYDKKVAS